MAKKIFEKKLSLEEFNNLRRASNDVFFFALFIWIINPNKGGRVKFNLFPFQKSVLYQFLKNRFNIILKFRQAGITELISLYVLWFAMFHPNKNIIILSIKDSVAKKVLRRIKYMYKNLPEYMQVPIVNGRNGEYGTSTEIIFANGSTISSIPTTEQAARSEAVSILVIDEAAIVRWADQIWAAAYPTLSTGGSAIINSTPYGVGNFFHKMWVKALTRENGFIPIRLKWEMHPERDIEWYKREAKNMGPRRTAQEIDGNFLASGNTVFDLANIREMQERIENITWEEMSMSGSLYTFEKPNPVETYTIAGDCSSGRSRDYSTFSIYNSKGVEVACFKKKLEPVAFAKLLMKKGFEYNYATLAPETNDLGLAVTSYAQEQSYPRLYYSTKILRKRGEPRASKELIPGWYTSTKNRSLIISELEEDIRMENVELNNPFFVQEALTFIYDESNRPVAIGKGKKNDEEDLLSDEGYTDDSIFAAAIGNRVRKERRPKFITHAR